MKKLTLVVLLLTIVFQSSVKLAIYVRFKLNQQYYAKNECVKKAIVDNDCEGNCCLKKQLNAEEKKEPTIPALLKKHNELLFVQPIPNNVIKPQINYTYVQHNTHYTVSATCDVAYPLLRPPTIA